MAAKIKLLVLVVVLLTRENALGDYEEPDEHDYFMLSRLYVLSKPFREANPKVTLLYYHTTNRNHVNLHDDEGYVTRDSFSVSTLGCNLPRHLQNNSFSNYILIPRYPTDQEIDSLDNLSVNCKRLFGRRFRSYVVGYTGSPPNNTNSTVIRSSLIITLVPLCNNSPASIPLSSLNDMTGFVRIFHQSFEGYRRRNPEANQYAVLYYGPNITQAKAPSILFNRRRYRHLRSGSGWMASLPDENHSEYYLTDYVRCGMMKGDAIYLYTYNSPCADCAQKILQFAKKCLQSYSFFNVFYSQQWKDCCESSYAINQVKDQLKMNFFHLNNTTHATN